MCFRLFGLRGGRTVWVLDRRSKVECVDVVFAQVFETNVAAVIHPCRTDQRILGSKRQEPEDK